jgi:methylenetetrahydrofolate reductase (NADPH)
VVGAAAGRNSGPDDGDGAVNPFDTLLLAPGAAFSDGDPLLCPSAGRPPVHVSFEFFPPKTEAAQSQLLDALDQLAPMAPHFVSVTYGAGGGTRQRTRDTLRRIRAQTALPAAGHLTCVGAERAAVDDVARRYWADGIRHVVALRGDPPAGERRFTPTPGGYACAAELVAGLKRVADFEISVAAYPEVHPEAASPEADLDNLKRKIDAGAARAITQFFFDPQVYLRFRDRAAAAGIDVPIVPGILPIGNFARVCDFAKGCGASVPDWMAALFDGLDDEPEQRQLVAAAVAAQQCRQLFAAGVDTFHFYTLNRAALTIATCRMLGLRPVARPAGKAATATVEATA